MAPWSGALREVKMTPELTTLLASLAGILSALLGTFVAWRKVEADRQAAQDKSEAESDASRIAAQDSIFRTSTQLIEPLRIELEKTQKALADAQNDLRMQKIQAQRLAATLETSQANMELLKCQFEKLKEDYKKMVDGANLLVRQVRELGGEPVWKPNGD